MANDNFPLLFFPAPSQAERNSLGGGGGQPHTPGIARQQARITSQLAVLQQAFANKRLSVTQIAPTENPELVLVLQIAGTVANLANAVRKVPGLEWLLESLEEDIAPDEDFYDEDKKAARKAYDGRVFLLGTNQEALEQLLALWSGYSLDRDVPFARGLAPFKHVFGQLRFIRRWNVEDRVDADMRRYWQDSLDAGMRAVRFEIEAWYFATPQKNEIARAELEALVKTLDGRVLKRALITDIAYHGFLVELPSNSITTILSDATPELLLSDRIMFFRPKAQSITSSAADTAVVTHAEPEGVADQPPIVALLDGLPLSNHALLTDRLIVDDPDGWEANYEAKDRVHGTAMASLITWGELDGASAALKHRLYVRPIMRPEPSDNFHPRRREQTPDDELLIDLIHRAVKRICEGETELGPAAPTVRVINLSMGLATHPFVRDMSPWARLIDWLAFRYSILFIVSAGNDERLLELGVPRNVFSTMTSEDRASLAFTAMTRESIERRLISPAEAMNALTVGALHEDRSAPLSVPNRHDLFTHGGLSPTSRIGHGYRRSVKPDILVAGGRVIYRERITGNPKDNVVLEASDSLAAPGHRAAIPPLPGESLNSTAYSRGTSNAAALASRAATLAYDAIQELRLQNADAPAEKFDAVLLKALLVHGAHWAEWPASLLAERPEFQNIANATIRRNSEKDFVTRWLGYGPANVDRMLACTAQRATLIGVGELGCDEALVFSAPLPPSLAGKKEWRRLTITLAWISPINFAHQSYRRAKLWIAPPQQELRVKRVNGVHDKAALRGTVQHELLEGKDAAVFVDGDRFACKVNCAADAGELTQKVRFALCISLEVGVDSQIAIYQEIRERIQNVIRVQSNPI